MRSDRAELEATAERIVDHIQGELGRPAPRPVLIRGGVASGKTRLVRELADRLRDHGISVGGILAPRIVARGRTVGYSVVDLATGEVHPFASTQPPGESVGRFFVSEPNRAFACRVLEQAPKLADVVIVDEIGRWELSGGGYAEPVREILAAPCVPVLIVRDSLSDRIRSEFEIEDETIFSILPQSEEGERVDPHSPLWAIVDGVEYPLLITHGASGHPESRPMNLIERDGSTLWFVTSRASRKVRQIGAHRQVTVFFIDTERFNYASIHGRAAMVDDPERGRRLWREEWREEWAAGPADSDYALLRVDGEHGYYYRGATGESGNILLG